MIGQRAWIQTVQMVECRVRALRGVYVSKKVQRQAPQGLVEVSAADGSMYEGEWSLSGLMVCSGSTGSTAEVHCSLTRRWQETELAVSATAY